MKPSTKGEEEQEEDTQQAQAQAPVFTPGSQDQRAKTPQAPQKLYTDSEGLDMAYGDQSNMFLDPQGTLFVSGTKGGSRAGVDRKLQNDGRPTHTKDAGHALGLQHRRKREVYANR